MMLLQRLIMCLRKHDITDEGYEKLVDFLMPLDDDMDPDVDLDDDMDPDVDNDTLDDIVLDVEDYII